MTHNYIERLTARHYYGNHAVGVVVLVNGTPHHFTGRLSRRDALKFMASFI